MRIRYSSGLLAILMALPILFGAGCKKRLSWRERRALRHKVLAEKIEKAMKSPEAKVRKQAIRWMKYSSSVWKKNLFKLFSSDPDPTVRLAAIQVLAKKRYGRPLLWQAVLDSPKDKDKFFILKNLSPLKYADREWILKVARGKSYQAKVRLGRLLGEALKARRTYRDYKRVKIFGKWRYRYHNSKKDSKYVILPFNKTVKAIYKELAHYGTYVRKALWAVVQRQYGYSRKKLIKALVDLNITPNYYIKKKLSASARKDLLEAITQSSSVSDDKKKEALTTVLNDKLKAAWSALNSISGSTRRNVIIGLLESGMAPPRSAISKLKNSVRLDIAKVLHQEALSRWTKIKPVVKALNAYLWRAVRYMKSMKYRSSLLRILFRYKLTPPSGFAYYVTNYNMGKVFQRTISQLSDSEIVRNRTYYNIIAGYIWKALKGLYRAQGPYLMVLLKKKMPRPEGALKHLHWNNSSRIAKLLDDLSLDKQLELGIRKDVQAVYEQIAKNALKLGKPAEAREYFLKAGKAEAFNAAAVAIGEKALKAKNYIRAITLLRSARAEDKLREAYAVVRAKYSPLAAEAYKTGRYKEALSYALKSYEPHILRDHKSLTALKDAAAELAKLKTKIGASATSRSADLLARHMTLKSAMKTPALLEGANKYLIKVYPYLQIISSLFRKLKRLSKKLIRPYLQSFECVKNLLHKGSFRLKKGMSRIKLADLKP